MDLMEFIDDNRDYLQELISDKYGILFDLTDDQIAEYIRNYRWLYKMAIDAGVEF